MPDLGKYAIEVLGAYAASIGLLALIVAATFWRGRRVRQRLEQMDSKDRADG